MKVIQLPAGSSPDAEIDAQGVIHVAYLSDHDVFYARSANDGEEFSEPIRVNSETGFASGGLYRGPDLALGKKGRVHVAWYNNAYSEERPKQEWGVMYARLNEAHTGFETSRNLNRTPSDNYSLAADEKGTVAVIWMAEGLFISLSSDGGQTFAPPLRTDADPCECCASRALYAGSGNLYFAYRSKANNDRDMYLGQLRKDASFTSPARLNEVTWHLNACPVAGTSLTRDGENLLAAWESAGSLYFARLDQEGRVMDPGEVEVSSSGKYPVVLPSNDIVLVAWKEGAVLRWRMFDDQGQPLGGPLSAESITQHRPAGVVGKSGKFLLFP